MLTRSHSHFALFLLAVSAATAHVACGPSPRPDVTPPIDSPDAAAADGDAPRVDAGPDGTEERVDAQDPHAGPAPIAPTPVVRPYVYGKTAWGGVAPGVGADLTTATMTGPCVTGPIRLVALRETGTASNEAVSSGRDLLDALLLGNEPDRVTIRTAPGMIAGADKVAAEFTELESLELWSHDAVSAGFDPAQKLELVPGATCPADFVFSVNWGARLAYGLKLRFADTSAREEFRRAYAEEAQVVRSRDAHEVGWIGYDWKDRATVQLVAFQLGGKPDSLQALLDGSACTIGNLVECKETLVKVDDYARTTFLSDLGPEPTLTDAHGWVPVAVRPRKTSTVLRP
jgi:hypothetical protein